MFLFDVFGGHSSRKPAALGLACERRRPSVFSAGKSVEQGVLLFKLFLWGRRYMGYGDQLSGLKIIYL
jgi:hypothetical protein